VREDAPIIRPARRERLIHVIRRGLMVINGAAEERSSLAFMGKTLTGFPSSPIDVRTGSPWAWFVAALAFVNLSTTTTASVYLIGPIMLVARARRS
jgi:hypothetical protein